MPLSTDVMERHGWELAIVKSAGVNIVFPVMLFLGDETHQEGYYDLGGFLVEEWVHVRPLNNLESQCVFPFIWAGTHEWQRVNLAIYRGEFDGLYF